jgi:S1-C subfamily serine protease
VAAPGAAPGPSAGTAPTSRPGLRHRILPRTLLGITGFILALSIGAAFSGVVLYSYYQYRLDQTNSRVDDLLNGYQTTFANAQRDLTNSANQAQRQIQAQLSPLQAAQADPATLAALVKQLAPSLFFVHTLDAQGQSSVGTAFVISSGPSQSLLLTSYTTVEAATRAPGPVVYVRQGTGADIPISVRTWDPTYDLALLVLPRGHLPVVTAAPATPAPTLGTRVYAVSGLGSAGAAVTEGTVSDVSVQGIQHDAPVGTAYQGGPLVDGAGQVVAVASRTYQPLGFSTDAVWYAPYLTAACNKVLVCPGGVLPAGT